MFHWKETFRLSNLRPWCCKPHVNHMSSPTLYCSYFLKEAMHQLTRDLSQMCSYIATSLSENMITYLYYFGLFFAFFFLFIYLYIFFLLFFFSVVWVVHSHPVTDRHHQIHLFCHQPVYMS